VEDLLVCVGSGRRVPSLRILSKVDHELATGLCILHFFRNWWISFGSWADSRLGDFVGREFENLLLFVASKISDLCVGRVGADCPSEDISSPPHFGINSLTWRLHLVSHLALELTQCCTMSGRGKGDVTKSR